MLETKALRKVKPNLHEDNWPQFELLNATVHPITGGQDELQSILSIEAIGAVNIRGFLKVKSKDKNYVLSQGYKTEPIEISSVIKNATEEIREGEWIIWAAGQCGWYNIKPAERYKSLHKSDIEAAKIKYVLQEFNEGREDGTIIMRGSVQASLYRHLIESTYLDCTTPKEVDTLFEKHHVILISFAVDDFYKRCLDHFRANETYLTKYFRLRFPRKLNEIHERMLKFLAIPSRLTLATPSEIAAHEAKHSKPQVDLKSSSKSQVDLKSSDSQKSLQQPNVVLPDSQKIRSDRSLSIDSRKRGPPSTASTNSSVVDRTHTRSSRRAAVRLFSPSNNSSSSEKSVEATTPPKKAADQELSHRAGTLSSSEQSVESPFTRPSPAPSRNASKQNTIVNSPPPPVTQSAASRPEIDQSLHSIHAKPETLPKMTKIVTLHTRPRSLSFGLQNVNDSSSSTSSISSDDTPVQNPTESKGCVDTIVIELDGIRRAYTGTGNFAELSLEFLQGKIRRVEVGRHMTSDRDLISKSIKVNARLLTKELLLEERLGGYNWTKTKLYSNLKEMDETIDTPTNDQTPPMEIDDEDEDIVPPKRRRLHSSDSASISSGTSQPTAQLRPRSTSTFASKSAMRAGGSPRGRPRGSRGVRGNGRGRWATTPHSPLGTPTPASEVQSPRRNGPGRPRGSRARGPRAVSGLGTLRQTSSDLQDADFNSNDSNSDGELGVARETRNSSLAYRPRPVEGWDAEQKSEKGVLKLQITPLPTFKAQEPGDLWTCPFDGCLQRVRNASSAEGIDAIQEHYDEHAEEDEKRNKKLGIVVTEARSTLPVSHLIDKIRAMAANRE